MGEQHRKGDSIRVYVQAFSIGRQLTDSSLQAIQLLCRLPMHVCFIIGCGCGVEKLGLLLSRVNSLLHPYLHPTQTQLHTTYREIHGK